MIFHPQRFEGTEGRFILPKLTHAKANACLNNATVKEF